MLAFKPETASYIYQHENMKSLLKHIVFADVKKCDWLELKRMNIRVALSTSAEYFGFKVLLFFRILSEHAFYQTIQTTSFFLTLVSRHHTHPFLSLPFGNSFLYYKLLTSV